MTQVLALFSVIETYIYDISSKSVILWKEVNLHRVSRIELFGSETMQLKVLINSQKNWGGVGSMGSYAVVECTASSWAAAVSRPFVAGQFVWSGFDYGNEKELQRSDLFFRWWKRMASSFRSLWSENMLTVQVMLFVTPVGVMDLCGFDKPIAGYYKSWWKTACSY